MGMLSLDLLFLSIGIVQIIPLLINHSSEEKIATLKPYTPASKLKEEIFIFVKVATITIHNDPYF